MRDRFILAAYPRGARRAEIEDLLLMAAADGHGHPGLSGVVNLLRHGLRARLGRVGSAGTVALAMIVSVVTGFLLASAANRLAWEGATDPPDGAARTALGELVAPGLPVQWSENVARDPFTVVGGHVRARQINGVAGDAGPADVDGYLAGLSDRLHAQGWHVQDISPTGPPGEKTGTSLNDSQVLLARNAHLILRVVDVPDPAEEQSRLDIHVSPTEPPWISGLTFAAGLLGMLLGWLLFGWGSRRTEHRPAATAAAGLTAVLGLALLAPAMSLGMIYLSVFTGDYSPEVPFWAGLAPASQFGGLAVLSGVALGTAALIAACCRPGPARKHATAA